MMRVLILNGVDVQHETTFKAEMQQIIQEVPSHGVKMFVITPKNSFINYLPTIGGTKNR